MSIPGLREQFIQAYLEAWADVYQGEKRAVLEVLYPESPRGWTEIMCGIKPKAMDERSLVRRALEKLTVKSLPVLFDGERQDVDAYGRVIPDGVHHHHTDGVNVVMVEVENSVPLSYEEFWKLVHSRCALKVLITYEPAGGNGLKNVKEMMGAIYRRANRILGPEDPAAYVLVLGTRATGSKTIQWIFEGLTADGLFFTLPAPSTTVESDLH